MWLKCVTSITMISLIDSFIDTNFKQNDDSLLSRAPLAFEVFKFQRFMILHNPGRKEINDANRT